ncbi:MAG: hypothetical protein HY644_12865 [Acidobacteria bacterium]|nr:hypothetical protein [Acidobacteriota bacterium]
MDDEVIFEVGKQKIRLGADTVEEDIDHFFNAVIEEVVVPAMETASVTPSEKSPFCDHFWEDVFSRIAEIVDDLSGSQRKIMLRALISLETYRRFQRLLNEEIQGSACG